MANFMDMMKQARQMQGKMTEMQEDMEKLEVSGVAGGDMVSVTLSGKGELKGIKIDPSLLKPEESEVLEDLLIAAHRDAKNKSEALMQEKMQEIAGDLPLPPGMKLF